MSYADKTKPLKPEKEKDRKWLPPKLFSSSKYASITRKPSFLQHRSTVPEQELEPYERGFLSYISEESEDKTKRIKNKINGYLEEQCESPFRWRPREVTNYANVSIARLLEKDMEIRDDRAFKWRNFILKLVISYEHYVQDESAKALEVIMDVENSLIRLANCHKWLFFGIKEVLWHVVKVSKAFLLLQLDELNKADRLASEICPAYKVRHKPASRAGLHAIKAAVFMEYGREGNQIALEEVKRAIKIDKTCGEWFFLKGKCLGRIRRLAFCHENVTTEEVGAFIMAIKRNMNAKENPEYLVHLAQALREQGLREFKTTYPDCKSDEFKKIMKKLAAAYYKYRQALLLRPDCPHILTRVAYGIMKLPDEYVDLKLIREMIDKSVKLAPKNSMVYHVKGQYHERFGVEADIALEAYAEAALLGNFGAAMDLIRMRYRLNNQYDVIKALKEAAEMYKDPLNQEVAYAQCGSFFLFVKKDLIKSLIFYSKAGGKDMDSYAMKSHKPMFIRMRDPVNMFDVLLEELENHTNWKDFDKENTKILKKFRISLMNHDTLEKKDGLSVMRILEMSRERMDKDTEFRTKYEQKPQKRKRRPFKWKQKKSKKLSDKKDESSSSPKGVHRERSNSRSRNSSVDSDYQRDSVVHGVREFSLMDSQSDANVCNKIDVLMNPFQRPCSISNKYSMTNERHVQERRVTSRSSSVSSTCSIEDGESSGIGRKSSFHQSRFSQSNYDSIVPTEGVRDLTIDVYSRDINIGTRKMSLMSISSDDCTSQSCENLSVQERVKETYRNSLSYKKNTSEVSNLNRSDSSQSLNKGQGKQQNSGKKSNFQRSWSTQSLNCQQINPFTSKYLEGGYRSAFRSRDPVEELTRSMSFLPSFVRQKSESDAE